MYWDIEVTPEDEDEMIEKIAQKIHSYGLDLAAILMIESIKPLSFIGTQMGRFFVFPILPIFGDNIGITGGRFLQIFEKRENVEKLIKAVEELSREEEREGRKKDEKTMKLNKTRADTEIKKKPQKGWKRFIPFVRAYSQKHFYSI